MIENTKLALSPAHLPRHGRTDERDHPRPEMIKATVMASRSGCFVSAGSWRWLKSLGQVLNSSASRWLARRGGRQRARRRPRGRDQTVQRASLNSSGRPRLSLCPVPAVRVIVNLLLIANECLMRGGKVEITASKQAEGGEVVVTATGPRAKLKEVGGAARRRRRTDRAHDPADADWLPFGPPRRRRTHGARERREDRADRPPRLHSSLNL